jgi:hypothetical protein
MPMWPRTRTMLASPNSAHHVTQPAAHSVPAARDNSVSTRTLQPECSVQRALTARYLPICALFWPISTPGVRCLITRAPPQAIERERVRIGGIGRSRQVGRRGVVVQGDPLIARSEKGRWHSMFAARNWFWTFDNQVDSSARPKRSHNASLRVWLRGHPQRLFERSVRGRRFWFCVSESMVCEYG